MIRYRFKTCRNCQSLLAFDLHPTMSDILLCRCVYLPRLDISKEDA